MHAITNLHLAAANSALHLVAAELATEQADMPEADVADAAAELISAGLDEANCRLAEAADDVPADDWMDRARDRDQAFPLLPLIIQDAHRDRC